MAQRFQRTPVEVTVKFTTKGEQIPLSITWKDGREFIIDEALPKKHMRCERTIGRDAFRYEIVIGGKKKLLYRGDDNIWFVEVPAPKNLLEKVQLETDWRRGPTAEPINR